MTFHDNNATWHVIWALQRPAVLCNGTPQQYVPTVSYYKIKVVWVFGLSCLLFVDQT